MRAQPRRGLTAGLVRALAVLVLLVQPAQSQGTTTDVTTTTTQGAAPKPGAASAAGGSAPTRIEGGAAPASLDYKVWAAMADRAEAQIADANTADAELERRRAQLADWREAFLGAQSANASRIATLRTQIDALGPLPAEGGAEAPEIAKRRSELSEQLVRLQAPGIAADEAYQRADGLIREIDAAVRDRQATALLRLWPAPINPANWPAALSALSQSVLTIGHEVVVTWASPVARARVTDNLPLILLLLVAATVTLARGRRWTEALITALRAQTALRTRRIWIFLASLGHIIVPGLGVWALALALDRAGLAGPVGQAVIDNLLRAGLTVFAAIWLGSRLFPLVQSATAMLVMPDDRRAEGRFLTTAFGILIALGRFRRVVLDQIGADEAVRSVLSFPIQVLAALVLFRFSQLLRAVVVQDSAGDEGWTYRLRLMNVAARLLAAIAIVSVLLGAIGYISAAAALVYPAGLSMALIGFLMVLQKLAADFYAVIARTDTADREALVPVLIGFALTLAALPVFALIWGARHSDLTELWTRFREGFQMGNARISPTDFLVFAVVFTIGFTLTRLMQGALKTSVLPRTSLDQGGQNAIVSGLGYVGIFLAALVAINSAGIDLSGLAIVAGALSVGIGFGLQTVVSNFVSGIILLIERPVSEGDWIEVGTTQGIVRSISVRSTRIQTFDRSDVIVPNSDLISGRVTNWTRFSLSGRLIVAVNVPYTEDSQKIAAILREVTEAQPLAVLNPAPQVLLTGFTGEMMNFEIRVILRDVNFSVQVRSDINHQIAARFLAGGVNLSNSHRDYREKKAEAAAAADEDAADIRASEAVVAALLGPDAPATSSFHRSQALIAGPESQDPGTATIEDNPPL